MTLCVVTIRLYVSIDTRAVISLVNPRRGQVQQKPQVVIEYLIVPWFNSYFFVEGMYISGLLGYSFTLKRLYLTQESNTQPVSM